VKNSNLLELVLRIMPRRFEPDKYRRLYMNSDSVDKESLKKIQSLIIKGFRVAIVEMLKKGGYKIDSRVLQNVEALGPDPEVLWLIFQDVDRVAVAIGDTVFHTVKQQLLDVFKYHFSRYIEEKGARVFQAYFAELNNAPAYILKRLFLADVSMERPSEGEEMH
jgi:hypothetical protein